MGMSTFRRIREAAKEANRPPDTKDFNEMTVNELKTYAKEKSIDISGLLKKDDIKAKIIEEQQDENDNPEGDDETPSSPGGANGNDGETA